MVLPMRLQGSTFPSLGCQRTLLGLASSMVNWTASGSICSLLLALTPFQLMIVDREDLRKLFSQQIDSLVTLINQQLDHIQRPGHSILLLLSGKFCQVPYVQHRLGHQFAGVSDRQYPITRLQVVPDINLSVCKGLVAKHMKDREAVDSILDGHCFGASYGLVCREIFNNDNLNHSGGFVRKDSSNKQTYVENVVDWIVKKVA